MIRSLVALLCLALLAGCACDSAESCHVVGPAEDGSSTLVCPDGTVVFPAPREYQGRGALDGSVLLFGLPPRAGLRVGLAGSDEHTTVTDAAGHFRLEQLPPGFRSLVFEAPGYEPQLRHELLVLPGDHTLPPVTLRPGRLVVSGAGQLHPSPRGDGCLFLTGRDLYRYHADTGVTELLSRTAGRPAYARGGSAVLFLERYDASSDHGSLAVLDLDSGDLTRIAATASQWLVSPDGSSVLVVARSREIGSVLSIWDWQSGLTSAVADRAGDFRLTPDGRWLTVLELDPFGRESTLILWNVAARGGLSLGTASSELPVLSPDGSSLVYRTAAGEPVLWDGLRKRAQRLDPELQLGSASFDDSGRFLLIRDHASYLLHDVATGSGERLDPAIFQAGLVPGGGGLVTVAAREGGGRELVLEELPGHALHPVWAGSLAEWSARPDELLFRTLDESGAGTLRSYSVVGGGATLAGAVPQAPVFDPSGERMLFISADELLRRDSGGETEELLVTGVKPGAWLDHGPGEDDALVFEWAVDGSGAGKLTRYDALLGRAVLLGESVPFLGWEAAGDGSLALLRGSTPRGDPVELALQQRGSRRAELVATGLAPHRMFRRGADGFRLVSYRDERSGMSSVAQLHDLRLGATVPLDSDVGEVAVGTGFVAYVVERGSERGLYVSRWPEAPPEPAPPPEDEGGPPPPIGGGTGAPPPPPGAAPMARRSRTSPATASCCCSRTTSRPLRPGPASSPTRSTGAATPHGPAAASSPSFPSAEEPRRELAGVAGRGPGYCAPTGSTLVLLRHRFQLDPGPQASAGGGFSQSMKRPAGASRMVSSWSRQKARVPEPASSCGQA